MSTESQADYEDYRLTHRSSIGMTQAMWTHLEQVVKNRREPKFNTSDAIREAIRLYLDQQDDLISSRKYFSKSLHRQITLHEQSVLFTLHALMLLMARLLAYLIKHQEGQTIEVETLIKSALVDSHKLSGWLSKATQTVRQSDTSQGG